MSDLTPCWSCRAPKEAAVLFCPVCKVIQPVGEDDPFGLFSIKRDYAIDQDKLEREYLGLQGRLHPDRFVGKDDKVRLSAQIASSSVNGAWETLKDPVRRAGRLLALEGVEADALSEKTMQDCEMLTEAMQLNEAMDEASSPQELDNLKKTVSADKDRCMAEITTLYRDRLFPTMQRQLIRLKYWVKVINDIDAKARRLRRAG